MERTLDELGMVRIGVAAPALRVADVSFNCERIERARDDAAEAGVQLLVLPEMCLTGYTAGDLYYQSSLQRAALEGLLRIKRFTESSGPAVVVGLPLRVGGRLFNCAALVAAGTIAGIVPKTYLPTRREYYERRHFASGAAAEVDGVELDFEEVPFGTDLLFAAEAEGDEDLVVGIEICEDLWAAVPPSSLQALAGATVLVNPSAGTELLGKVSYRRDLVRQQSARCLAAYAYAGAGAGESTTDAVFSGHCLIAENGRLLTETERFSFETKLAIADVDLESLQLERTLDSSYAEGRVHAPGGDATFRLVPFVPGRSPVVRAGGHSDDPARVQRSIPARPFVPSDDSARAAHCEEIFQIQTTGLAKRIQHVGTSTVTIGVSGGLDSTLALLVTARAFERLGLDPSGIEAVTMPGFGTTERTRQNAERLATALGATLTTVSIVDAVRGHFRDIGHDESVHDLTYENAQARERTQILMDLASRTGGFVVGTGDLSEFALGWCTYNGDHMSMYHVNAGVPKTLVRYIVEHVADARGEDEVAALLRDVCNTPITPELLPLDASGDLQQHTEATVGPYDLHDFFLFHTVRHPFAPSKTLFLAADAWQGEHDVATIRRWLETFLKRFFAYQFKRSAMPDGPKVGTVALSPRADWRMPSDASASVWLEDLYACDHDEDVDDEAR
jgi:NAD+ synthase (glutamine-hydrolysing)